MSSGTFTATRSSGPAPHTDAASFVTQSASPTVSPGQSFPVSFTVRNSGTSTWTYGNYWLANVNGQALGAASTQFFSGPVYPGQSSPDHGHDRSVSYFPANVSHAVDDVS